jgi:single-strand selective monofunctional uracil DNA glycosylase
MHTPCRNFPPRSASQEVTHDSSGLPDGYPRLRDARPAHLQPGIPGASSVLYIEQARVLKQENGGLDLIAIARGLRRDVSTLTFGFPVSHVYNPLEYAWSPHREYLERYGSGYPQVVLVGMNPGPFGMAQTGVPFGDVAMVRDWLGIDGGVKSPSVEHPKRPITGFACHRREVSGQRLWGWARTAFGTPERFFARFFVANYCPLCFIEASGRNRTPDRLPATEREPLFAACDTALSRTIHHLGPTHVIGIGRFAAARAAAALVGAHVTLGRVPHPSPASPTANLGWEAQMTKALRELGIHLP